MFLFDLAGTPKPNNDLEGTQTTMGFPGISVKYAHGTMGEGDSLSPVPHSFPPSAYICYVSRERNSNNCPSHRQARINLTITYELDQVKFMGQGAGLYHSLYHSLSGTRTIPIVLQELGSSMHVVLRIFCTLCDGSGTTHGDGWRSCLLVTPMGRVSGSHRRG